MTKVRWKTDHQLGGGKYAVTGQVADLPEPEARRKVAMDYAEPYVEPPAPPEGGKHDQGGSGEGAGKAPPGGQPTTEGARTGDPSPSRRQA